jgi:hypothetical protein
MSKRRKKGKRSGLAGFLDSYNERETGAGNVGNTALKTVVDAILGVPVGIAIGGAAGLWSLPFGLVLIGAGHHFKDQSGLLRITGASAIAYGVAKNIEFTNAAKQAAVNGVGGLEGTGQAIKDRLKTVKDDLLAAYFLDRLFKKGDSETKTAAKMAELDEDLSTVGAIDLSDLDLFEQFNQQEADEFEAQQAQEALYREPESLPAPDYSMNYPDSASPEAAFAMFDESDEPDLSEL